MSNIQAATKDQPTVADQLITRLFDHRHFTSGEISFFTRELGGERGTNLEEDFDKILKISENVCFIADNYSENLCKSSEKSREDISSRIDSLHDRATRILKIESEHKENETKLLHQVREEREKIKRDTYKRTLIDLEKVNESLMAEEVELERKYLMFEENLRKNRN